MGVNYTLGARKTTIFVIRTIVTRYFWFLMTYADYFHRARRSFWRIYIFLLIEFLLFMAVKNSGKKEVIVVVLVHPQSLPLTESHTLDQPD